MSANFKALRAQLAVETRAKKHKDLSQAELRKLWDSQLSEGERAALRQPPGNSEKTAGDRMSVSEAVQWSEDHLFDRNSVALECQLWQQALERGRGENFSVG